MGAARADRSLLTVETFSVSSSVALDKSSSTLRYRVKPLCLLNAAVQNILTELYLNPLIKVSIFVKSNILLLLVMFLYSSFQLFFLR